MIRDPFGCELKYRFQTIFVVAAPVSLLLQANGASPPAQAETAILKLLRTSLVLN
jgi:hypothetical protein